MARNGWTIYKMRDRLWTKENRAINSRLVHAVISLRGVSLAMRILLEFRQNGDDQVSLVSISGLEKWSKGDEKLEGCREYTSSPFRSSSHRYRLSARLAPLSSAPIISFALQDINDRNVSPICKVFRLALSAIN